VDALRQEVQVLRDEVQESTLDSQLVTAETAARREAVRLAEERNNSELCKIYSEEFTHVVPVSLRDHIFRVGAMAPRDLPENEFDLLEKVPGSALRCPPPAAPPPRPPPALKPVPRRGQHMTGEFEVTWGYDAEKPLPYWALGQPIAVPGMTDEGKVADEAALRGAVSEWHVINHEGQTLYVNHVLQQTTWQLPSGAALAQSGRPGAGASPGHLPAEPQPAPHQHADAAPMGKHGALTTLEGRVATFAGSLWPHKAEQTPLLDPLLLAESGLYSVRDREVPDRVKCAYCEVELGNLGASDDPRVLHAEASPACAMAAKAHPERGETQEVTAVADFAARSEDEVSFRKGDRVLILAPALDEGWYFGEAHDHTGLVPETHISPKPTLARPPRKSSLASSAPPPPAAGAAGARKSSVASAASAGGVGAARSYPVQAGPAPAVPADPAAPAAEHWQPAVAATKHARATFDYAARMPDELSFAADDVIELPTGEPSEPGWYQGVVAGRHGLVPSTHIEIIEGPPPARPPGAQVFM